MEDNRILLEEKTPEFKTALAAFKREVYPRLDRIKATYERLQLDVPFCNEVYQDLLTGGYQTAVAYEKRLNEVRKFLGISAGMVNPNIMTHDAAGALWELETMMNDLVNCLSTYPYDMPALADVVVVDGEAILPPEAAEKLRERYRTYLNPEDAPVMEGLQAFADALNELKQVLPESFYTLQRSVLGSSTLNALIIEQRLTDEETGITSTHFALNPHAFGYLKRIIPKPAQVVELEHFNDLATNYAE